MAGLGAKMLFTMLRSLLVVSALVSTSALAIACGNGTTPSNTPNNSPSGTTTTTPPAQGGTVLTVADDGKAITLARGGTLTVKLETQTGTGFSWDLTKTDAAVLAQQGERTTETPSNAPGGGGFDVFTFTGVAAGTTSLELAYRRPWQKDAVPARGFKVQVTVQ